jgi:hypothetical protein
MRLFTVIHIPFWHGEFFPQEDFSARSSRSAGVKALQHSRSNRIKPYFTTVYHREILPDDKIPPIEREVIQLITVCSADLQGDEVHYISWKISAESVGVCNCGQLW